jgi:hypothetical protein
MNAVIHEARGAEACAHAGRCHDLSTDGGDVLIRMLRHLRERAGLDRGH